MIFNQDNSDLIGAIKLYDTRAIVDPANLTDSWLLSANGGEYEINGASAAGGFLEGVDTPYGVLKVVFTPDHTGSNSVYGYVEYHSNNSHTYIRLFRRDTNAIVWRTALKRVSSAVDDTIAISVVGKQASTGAVAGQYVLVSNSTISGITDGLYVATKTIPANTNIDSTYLTSPSYGALNDLLSKTTDVTTFTTGFFVNHPTNNPDSINESRCAITVRNRHVSGSITLVVAKQLALGNIVIGYVPSGCAPLVSANYPAYVLPGQWSSVPDNAYMGYINTNRQIILNWGITPAVGKYITLIVNYDF